MSGWIQTLRWGLALGAIVVVACGDEPPGIGSEVLARLTEVEGEDALVTVGDLDRALFGEYRPALASEAAQRSERLAEVVRRLAADRLLLRQARLTGFDQQAELVELRESIWRRASVDAYLGGRGSITITEEDVQEAYDADQERFQRSERLAARHIFLRSSPERSRDEVEGELHDLRRKVVAGAAFERLAREVSDSESRHQDGDLGVVERGRFGADLERILFGLEVGEPSEPILTGDGGHLFLVTARFPAVEIPFSEARPLLQQELLERRRILQLEDEVRSVAPEASRPSDGELRELLRSPTGETVLFRVGERSWTLRDLVQEVNWQLEVEPDEAVDAVELARQLWLEGVVFEHLQQGDLVDGAGIEGEPERSLERRVVQRYALQRAKALAERDDEMVRAHFESFRSLFSLPPRVRLRFLRAPADNRSNALMRRLETASRQLAADQVEVGDVVADLDLTSTETELLTAQQLRLADPRALRFAFSLEPGEFSPPYSAVDDSLVLFEVLERVEPQEQPLARVRDQVVAHLVAERRDELLEQVRDEVLTEAGFVLDEQTLVAYRPQVPTDASD